MAEGSCTDMCREDELTQIQNLPLSVFREYCSGHAPNGSQATALPRRLTPSMRPTRKRSMRTSDSLVCKVKCHGVHLLRWRVPVPSVCFSARALESRDSLPLALYCTSISRLRQREFFKFPLRNGRPHTSTHWHTLYTSTLSCRNGESLDPRRTNLGLGRLGCCRPFS